MTDNASPQRPSKWAVFNEFLLNGSPNRFTKIFARYELFRRTIDLPGDIMECGVFKGAGLLFWAKCIEIFNPLSTKKVVGFDLFDAEPEAQTYEWDGLFLNDEVRKVTPESLMDLAREQGLEKRIVILPGDATRTIPKYAEDNPGGRISLLNLDFDNYDPTRCALDTFFPRVVPDGVVVFDDYAIDRWGESLAVDDYLADSGYVLRTFPWALSPKAYLIKGRKG